MRRMRKRKTIKLMSSVFQRDISVSKMIMKSSILSQPKRKLKKGQIMMRRSI